MPQCAAFGCKNRGEEQGVSLHRFPIRNPELLRQWVHNLGREGFTPTKASKVCSVHFLPNSYKEDPYAKYGIHSPRTVRTLKPDAVPTEFAHRHDRQKVETTRTISVARIEKGEHKAKVAKILFDYSKEKKATESVSVQGQTRVTSEKQSPKVIRKRSKGKKELNLEQQTFEQTSPVALTRKQSPRVIRKRSKGKKELNLGQQTFEQTSPVALSRKQTVLKSPKARKAVSTVTRSMLEAEIPEATFQWPLSPVQQSRKQLATVSKSPKKRQEVLSVTSPMLEEEIPEAIFQVPLSPVRQSRKQLPMVSYPAVVYGTPRRTKKDHSYAKKDTCTIGTQTPALNPDAKAMEATKAPETEYSSPLKESSPEADTEQLAEYLPTSESSTSESEGSSGSDHKNKNNPCQMMKFIVFEENLKELMKFCNKCGSAVISCKLFTRGSMVAYRISCHSGHSYIWQSQPLEQKQPVGNMLIAAAILLTGSTYAKMNAFAEVLKLQFFSKSVYNKIQKQSLLPVIQEAWEHETNSVIESLKPLGPVVLAGDARCDSPGHTAKYGSYTLMHTDGDGQKGTRKIVSMKLVQVSEVKNSNHMEPEGLDRCLKEVLDKQLDISVLATDQHIMVASNMRKNYKEIKHEFDIWHVAKGVKKKLATAAKTKGCEELAPWLQSVSNHLWWACATCEQDEQVLREKWLSVLQHITNNHHWSGNQKFHNCSHEQLSTTDKKAICWLKPTSPAFAALKKIVTSTRLLKALKHLTRFCHTGELEVFHSMLLKYCPKRQHFHYDAMSARLMLAAIEWNHSRREVKLDASGNPVTAVVYSKRRKSYILKNKYERVKSGHFQELMERVYQIRKESIELPSFERPEGLAKNVAPIEKPDKEGLIQQFKSRFK